VGEKENTTVKKTYARSYQAGWRMVGMRKKIEGGVQVIEMLDRKRQKRGRKARVQQTSEQGLLWALCWRKTLSQELG
jgi:hypothetical protein